MKYAIISDVHSNLEALECALEEIHKRKVDQIICLGDVVGYGANPSECLELVRGASCEMVMGNHDQAVEDLKLRNSFTDWAREAIEWTANTLSQEEKKRIREFAPVVIDKKRHVTWTHGTPYQPEEFHYLFSEPEAYKSFLALKTHFCFFGHTHIPSLFSKKAKEARYLTAGTYQLAKDEFYLVNPGSVGQPRDRNSKLSFVLFDSDQLTLEIVRLDYDRKKAAEKIRKAGLPAYLADRLL